jgi:hypothetical protein
VCFFERQFSFTDITRIAQFKVRQFKNSEVLKKGKNNTFRTQTEILLAEVKAR